MHIALFGCGNMGSGLAEGLKDSCQLFFYDRNAEKAKALERKGFGTACGDIKTLLELSEVVVLCTKPQDITEVAEQLNKYMQDQIVVSLLSGITLNRLKELFPNQSHVRMMPNLALVCGEGVIGLSTDDEALKRQFTKILEPLGLIYWIDEEKMDALTSLTGSGPAFFYAMIEAMVESGVHMGFSHKDSLELVEQMLFGSLALIDHTKKAPSELRALITSPNGTTMAGLKKFNEHHVAKGIIETFKAAKERAIELGKGK